MKAQAIHGYDVEEVCVEGGRRKWFVSKGDRMVLYDSLEKDGWDVTTGPGLPMRAIKGDDEIIVISHGTMIVYTADRDRNVEDILRAVLPDRHFREGPTL